MNRKAKLSLIALTVIGVLAGGALLAKAKMGGKEEKKPEAPPLLQFTPSETARVQSRSMPVILQSSGVLAAERSATIRAKTSATITALSVREGDTVKVGQILAQLDTAELQQKVFAQEGALAAAQGRLVGAKKLRDQQQNLLAQQFITQSALDNAQSSYDAALGDERAAKAQLSLAHQALGDAVLRTPISGTVAKRYVQAGEKVGFDAPLVQVVDLSSLEMQAWVPPEALGLLKVGSRVNVQVSGVGNAPIVASVKALLPVADAATRQVGIVMQIPNATQQLKAGLQASASIVLDSRNGLTIPSSAVADNAGVTSVWLASAKDAASAAKNERNVSRVPVTVSLRDDSSGLVQITSSALKEGDLVLAGRYDGLRDGQTVKLLADTPASAASSVIPASAATK